MIISVLVELSNRNIDKTFDYIVPNSLINKIKIGIRVCVPFGNQVLEGFVIGIKESSTCELKEIISVVDEEVILNDELLELGKYISNTTLSTLISAYQVMLPTALKAKNGTVINKKEDKYIELNIDVGKLTEYKFSEKQDQIIRMLLKESRIKKSYLTKISAYTVKSLLEKGLIKETTKEIYRLSNENIEIKEKFPLTEDQTKVVNEVLTSPSPRTFLLHGVTGSGKTEVYMEIIEEMMQRGKNSIVLVPEISLTPQMVQRFKSRFGRNIAIFHSALSDGEKYDEYRKIVRGEVNIVIGARSAIFVPLKNIGAIIIDEEHSSTYKQDNNPKYNAIDIAIKRSLLHKSLVILGSATPSLESYAKSLKGVYTLLELKNRVNNRSLPNVSIIDLNKEIKKSGYFSKTLIDKIQERLDRKEQIILLLNRRGYSSFITCHNCGYVEKCPNCDITLTYHKSSNTLRCHYCGYGDKVKDKCPKCGESSLLNLGIGTEKVEEELHKLFDARVVRMDLDTTSKKGSHEKIINDFKDYKYDILLGTQMIAKGLDFANVTLVGVINADTSLLIPSYKSSENTFQLLCQVSGRSGRGDKVGEVVIQTFNPDHYAILCSKYHDYISFFKQEMNIRRNLNYPPYYYLTSIKVMSKDYDLAKSESGKISSILKNQLTNSTILGPSICSVFKVNNIYRFNIIIKYKKEDNLYSVLNDIIDYYKSNIKLSLDIDFSPSNI